MSRTQSSDAKITPVASPAPDSTIQHESGTKLRILLLNEFFYPDDKGGGSGSATSYFARRLSQDFGVSVTTIASRYAYRDPDVRYGPRDHWVGGEVYRVRSPNWGRVKSMKRLVGNFVLTFATAARGIMLPKADLTLVVTNPVVLPIAARIIKLVRGTPYVYMIYDLEPDRVITLGVKGESSIFVKLMRRWQSIWLHGAVGVIAIGRCMRDRLIRQYSLDPDRVVVAEIGADPAAVVPQSKASAFRAKNGIEGFVVLYSGNFGRYHDFDTIFSAAEQLRISHPDVRFVLVGGGHKRTYILDEVARRGLSNVLVFPFVPESEFSDLLASADMSVVTLEQGMEGVCVPSKFYSFLSSGRPIVALMSPESEVARVILENQIGYCIQTGDGDALARAVIESKADPEKLDVMGRRAREVFDSLYTADHITEKVYAALVTCQARK